MSALKQVVAMTALNLQSVPKRLGSASVIVIGIAGVAGVLVSILAMVNGLTQMMTSTGRADRAIVLGRGTSIETLSNLSHEAAAIIVDAAGIKHGKDGRPIVSTDALVTVRLSLQRDGTQASLSLRGVSRSAFLLHPEWRLVEGRPFEPGVRELIVGRSAYRQFAGLEVGKQISLRGAAWTVVGVFTSHGDPHEAELMTGVETLQSAFQRNTFQSVGVLLYSPHAFDAFKVALTGNPALPVDVLRESDYYALQSGSFSRMLSMVAYVIGGVMAVGAVFGALNAMYSAVSARALEIATLRVLGFGAAAVAISVFVEALLLAVAGGMVGGSMAWLLFNGHDMSTSGGGATQLTAPIAVDLSLIGVGILWSCVIGMIGASFPAIRAARAPLAAALRGS